MIDQEEFRGEIRVASRIVDYLSSGLYESPGACLKELVNNSYDADATHVGIFVKPDADRIIIEDDGLGLSRAEFVRHFDRVAESYKRDDGQKTPSGRPKVGKIGIGFIAANEICDEMEIFSTKKGSPDELHVVIAFDAMRASDSERRRDDSAFVKADYTGEILTASPKAHYTRIFLNRVRGDAKTILASARALRATKDSPSLYGLTATSIAAKLTAPSLSSWSKLDRYSQTMLQVALNVPVPYYEHWLPPALRRQVADLQREVSSLNFNVNYDGSELRKPVLLGANVDRAFVSRFKHEGKAVSAKGYFYVQDSVLRPQELNGLLIRIRNAAVGDYDSTFLNFPISQGTLFQRWISAEVWADDRLEDAMNIDRRTLRVAHPAYVEFQKAIHDHLTAVLKEARSKVYEARAKTRRHESAKAGARSMVEFARTEVANVDRRAAKAIETAWANGANSPVKARRLLRKYTIEELYRLVLEVAEEVLDKDQLAEFIQRLTSRMSR